MPQKTFSANDVIRIVQKHLTSTEQTEVVEILCDIEGGAGGATESILDEADDIIATILERALQVAAVADIILRVVPFAKQVLKRTPIGRAITVMLFAQKRARKIKRKLQRLRRAKQRRLG